MDKIKGYETITVQIAPEVYQAAEKALRQIGCSVEQYCALCLLRGMQYYRDIPGCAEMPSDELTKKVYADVVEEICLYNINRPDRLHEDDVH